MRVFENADSVVEPLLITWFAVSPLASYYVRVPTDRSILTFDRITFALIGTILCARFVIPSFSNWRGLIRVPEVRACRFEITWGALCVLALTSVAAKSHDVAPAARMAVDSFVLPLVAFHLARYHLSSDRSPRRLIEAGIILALFLLATGAFEFVSRTNLFAYKGSELAREGELRVNGPFSSDTEFEVISLLLALFLRAAPRLFSVQFDRAAAFIYWLGLISAVAAAVLPLSRTIGVALVICWVTFEVLTRAARSGPPVGGNHTSRSGLASKHVFSGAALALAVIIAFAIITRYNPNSDGQRLLSARNAFSRLATWRVGLEISSTHLLTGVGLGNYMDSFRSTFSEEDRQIASEMDTKVARGPHSNPVWILSELGVPGLALYLLAFGFILLMGCRGLGAGNASAEARAAAACFIVLLIAYSIPGLTLASGYYSALNLYFFFLMGFLSRRIS